MKAVVLISGGLDSTLAARLIQEQGVEVVALRFKIPFCLDRRKNSVDLGIEIKELDIGNEFIELVKHPRYGYGANMNPCIDCKILMLKKAKEIMEQINAGFVATGEVLGQRPMSQNRAALELIEEKSGLKGFLLRPLSAKVLTPTIPEEKNWVARERFLSFSGRTRKPQIELAKKLGIQEYAQPAGGCLLTDPEYARRLKDLLSHKELNLDNIELLKRGRHFRLSSDTKLILGRNEKENEELLKLTRAKDYLFMPLSIAGPTALGRGKFSEDLIRLSCSIISRYCDLNTSTSVYITYKRVSEKEGQILKVSPIQDTELINFRI